MWEAGSRSWIPCSPLTKNEKQKNHLRLRVRDDDPQRLHAERESRQPLDQLRRKQSHRLRLVRVSGRGGVDLVPLVELPRIGGAREGGSGGTRSSVQSYVAI